MRDAALRHQTTDSRYFNEIKKFPLLSLEEERALARRWRDKRDPEAARLLVGAHLRYVVKVARGFSGYGLPLNDLISEGNVGLMQALDRFDPDRGPRFVTYATWWVRAAIQDYVLRTYLPVRAVTTADRKKLFFNLRRLKAQRRTRDGEGLSPESVQAIADELKVSTADVEDMNAYLEGGEHSLNATLNPDSGEEWQDFLVDEVESPEILVVAADQLATRRRMMKHALDTLNDRERNILCARRLTDSPPTLEDLAQKFGVSRERIRQIEVRAYEKLQAAMHASRRLEPVTA